MLAITNYSLEFLGIIAVRVLNFDMTALLYRKQQVAPYQAYIYIPQERKPQSHA